MSALEQGTVIEVPARDLLAWGDVLIGHSDALWLVIMRDTDGPVLRVRVIYRCDHTVGWVPVSKTLFETIWAWQMPSQPLRIVPKDTVLEKAGKTMIELRNITEEYVR